MSYATAEDYIGMYPNEQETVPVLDLLLEEASDQVDKLTYNRIRRIGLEGLTAYQQAMIRKATCYQAHYNHEYGAYTDSPLGSYSIGDVSLSFKDTKVQGISVARKALDCISQTGLNSRRL